MDADVQRLIDHYGLQPLPVEQTLYRSTWVSQEQLPGGGPVGTAIVAMYLADPPSRSLFHRLAADEVWHFYRGDPIRLVLLDPGGTTREVVLGHDHSKGQYVQYVIRAGTWQAGELVEGGRFALFGCTMAPGFVGASFEGGTISTLSARYPESQVDIARLGVHDADQSTMPEGFSQ
jgi:predicted cupin superfamily sugar epimerase